MCLCDEKSKEMFGTHKTQLPEKVQGSKIAKKLSSIIIYCNAFINFNIFIE